MHGGFPNTTGVILTVKAPALLADIGFALLLYFAVRRLIGVREARWATVVYWLNPAVILDAAALGYLDPQFVLPIGGSLVAAAGGWPSIAGALCAAAVLTKPQALVVGPAIALAIWRSATGKRPIATMATAAASGSAVVAALFAPILAAGAGPNIRQALGRLGTHDMLSGNACNLWWLVGWIVRALYSISDYGVWGAFRHETRILAISRFTEVGYPNPRPIGIALTGAAIAWALWKARRSSDLWLAAALGAFCVHAYFTLSAQVHENHLFAAVPLLALAAAGRRRFAPILAATTVIVALNLNLFYGISEDVGYAVPRGLTIIDMTVVLAAVNCAVLVWHGVILNRECSRAVGVPQPSVPV